MQFLLWAASKMVLAFILSEEYVKPLSIINFLFYSDKSSKVLAITVNKSSLA